MKMVFPNRQKGNNPMNERDVLLQLGPEVDRLIAKSRAKVDQAVMAVAELTRCCQEIDLRYLHLGKMLLYVKENELYKWYSEHTQTMSAFLREIDIGIGMSAADHYIRVYKTFGERLAGRQIAFKRLLMVHPLVAGPETIGPLLDMCQNMPLAALSDEIRERSGKVPTDKCEHPTDEIRVHYRCSICGQWLKDGKPYGTMIEMNDR